MPFHFKQLCLELLILLRIKEENNMTSFIYLLIYDCAGSSVLHKDFLQSWWAGDTFHCSAWASHYGDFSCCGPSALGTRASVAVAHGLCYHAACGIFLDQDGTHIPCIGRWILKHWTTREVQDDFLGYLSPYERRGKGPQNYKISPRSFLNLIWDRGIYLTRTKALCSPLTSTCNTKLPTTLIRQHSLNFITLQ